ncbi:MAG: response regulator transcription factor [Adlercreutzia equolifaciens]
MVIVPLDVGAQEKIRCFARAVGLTAREAEILGLLVRGRTLPYIANELFVTTGTVKTHVRHIYEKSLVNNRQELLDKVEAR